MQNTKLVHCFARWLVRFVAQFLVPCVKEATLLFPTDALQAPALLRVRVKKLPSKLHPARHNISLTSIQPFIRQDKDRTRGSQTFHHPTNEVGQGLFVPVVY